MQTVALEVIDRKLSHAEIESIKDKIASKINWYDAIAEAIHENTKTEKGS